MRRPILSTSFARRAGFNHRPSNLDVLAWTILRAPILEEST